MRFLGVFRLGAVGARNVGQIGLAEVLQDGVAGGGNGFARHLHAVGAHIGDEPHGLAADVRRLHRGAGRSAWSPWRRSRACAKPPAAGSRCGRAGRGDASPGLLSTASTVKRAARQRPPRWRGPARPDLMSSLPSLLPSMAARRAEKTSPAAGAEDRPDRPVFLGVKGLDLELAVTDKPQGDRLHAAGRARTGQLAPQHRREGEADEIVERAARQIGIDQSRVELAGIAHRLEHGLGGDGVEHDALDELVLEQRPSSSGFPGHARKSPRLRDRGRWRG